MNYTDEKIFWIWLKTVFKYSNVKLHKLLAQFGGPDRIFNLDENEIERILFLTDKEKEGLKKKDIKIAYKIYENAVNIGAEILCFNDRIYPEDLKNIYDPPAVLYMRGDSECLNAEMKISVVGTRRCDGYGREIVKSFSFELADSGAVIVSGMAEGIDSAAHAGALEARGKTIAVFGTAIDKIYPASNVRLHNEILKSGLVVSEHPPGYGGGRYDFQRRNRIIAGLSRGVLICQAPERSGSLITARMALDFGRDVFCIPGNACDLNYGSNSLIRDGCAQMVLSPEEILAEYGYIKSEEKPDKHISKSNIKNDGIFVNYENENTTINSKSEKNYDSCSQKQKRIIEELKNGEMFADDLCERLDMDFSELGAEITAMELLDIVFSNNGKVMLK